MHSATPPSNIQHIKVTAYLALVLALVFFSGLMGSHEWYGFFDFTTLNGGFGNVLGGITTESSTPVTSSMTFRGQGGTGAMDGFLFAFGLIPTVMFALGMIRVFEHYGALYAAHRLLTPLLRPLLGISGAAGLAMIGSLQSTDVGASLTRNMHDKNQLSTNGRDVFVMFQFSGGAMLTNFFSSGAILFTLHTTDGSPALPISMGLCLVVIFFMKVFGANLLRLIFTSDKKKSAAGANRKGDN